MEKMSNCLLCACMIMVVLGNQALPVLLHAQQVQGTCMLHFIGGQSGGAKSDGSCSNLVVMYRRNSCQVPQPESFCTKIGVYPGYVQPYALYNTGTNWAACSAAVIVQLAALGTGGAGCVAACGTVGTVTGFSACAACLAALAGGAELLSYLRQYACSDTFQCQEHGNWYYLTPVDGC